MADATFDQQGQTIARQANVAGDGNVWGITIAFHHFPG